MKLEPPPTRAPRLPSTAFERAAARAPVRGLRELVGAGPVFVLAPHPDDESLACGGLMAACANAGIGVHVRVLTDGRHSHPGSRDWPPERIAAHRRSEAGRAGGHLGLARNAYRFERAEDGSLLFDWSRACATASRLAAIMRRWPSPVLVAPWRGDPHPDHLAAAVIADMAERQCRRVRALRYMIWARANGATHLFDGAGETVLRFDVSAFRAHKRRAVHAHRTQVSRIISDVSAAPAPQLSPFLGRFELYLTSRA